MEFKEQQRLYILFGIFGIAILVIYYSCLLRPQFSRFIANNREFRRLRAEVKSAEVLIANESRIRNQYENLKEESKIVERSLPSEEEISSLLESLSDIAESSGVNIQKIKPSEVIDEEGSMFCAFPILIEAMAGYHQCGKFINKLENMERFIKIEGVDIKGGDKDLRYHEIKLKVVTYVMK